MKALLFSIFTLAVFHFCEAQTAGKQKTRFTVQALGGRSFFAANDLASPSRFPTNEFRLGVGVIRPISKQFDLISGLNLGVKMKGERMYPPGSTPQGISRSLPPPIDNLEETVNSNNHEFIEIPLMARYYFLKNRLGVNAGFSFRNFFPSGGHYDSSGKIYHSGNFFSNRKEVSGISGLSLKVNSRFSLTGYYFFGLTNFFSEYSGDPQNVIFRIKNQSWQAGLEYRIDRAK
jgi:hypothetical protein